MLTARQLISIIGTPKVWFGPSGQQRACGRINAELNVVGRRVSGTFVGPVLNFTVTDISTAGFGLRSTASMVCGEEMLIYFPVKGEEPIVVRSIVRWCRAQVDGFQIGAEYVSVMSLDAEEERATVEAFSGEATRR